MKRITRKFYAVVVQDKDKEMQKKSVLHVQSCCCYFFVVANETYCFFLVCVFVLPFSLPPSFSITRLYFYTSKLSSTVTSASLLALAKYVC